MTPRDQFLTTLRAGLRGLPPAMVADIVADYQTHFAEAAAAGRTEAEAAAKLGDPARLARELRAEAGLKRWEEQPSAAAALGAIVAVLGLATIDFFVMLPILLILGVIVLALLIAALVTCFAGALCLVTAFFHAIPGFSGTYLQGILLGIGVTSGGASAAAFCLLFVIGLVNLLTRYGRLHIRAAAPITAPTFSNQEITP